MAGRASINYDCEIQDRARNLRFHVGTDKRSTDLTKVLRHWRMDFPVKLLVKYFLKLKEAEPEAWHSLQEQLSGVGGRVGETTILAPVHREPRENLLRLIDSVSNYKGELILLFNSGKKTLHHQKENDRKTLQYIDLYAKAIAGPLKVLVVDAIGRLKSPSIGTARDLLLGAEAVRSIAANSSVSSLDYVLGRKLLITDADCRMSKDFMRWFDGVFEYSEPIVAVTPKVKFLAETDKLTSEGITCKDHLQQVLVGEFYRNIISLSSGGPSDRDAREWVGMGIGVTFQAAILTGGFPHGWKRKEDHYFGAMVETLAECTSSSIYHAVSGDPSVESIVRGSNRTDAGFGAKGGNGRPDLVTLCELANSQCAETISRMVCGLSSTQKIRILRMPATELLSEFLGCPGETDEQTVECRMLRIFEGIEAYADEITKGTVVN